MGAEARHTVWSSQLGSAALPELPPHAATSLLRCPLGTPARCTVVLLASLQQPTKASYPSWQGPRCPSGTSGNGRAVCRFPFSPRGRAGGWWGSQTGGSTGGLSPTHYAADRVFHIQGFLPARSGEPCSVAVSLTHHQPILTHFHLRHVKLRASSFWAGEFSKILF